MTCRAQMRILNLCKGKTIKEAGYRLSIAQIYHAQRVCAQRIRLAKLTVGE